MGEIGEMERKMGANGGKWGKMGEIEGIAHGMWVVEGCGGMWAFFRSSFANISSPTHSQTEKWEFLPLTDTHCHGGWCVCLSDAPSRRAP